MDPLMIYFEVEPTVSALGMWLIPPQWRWFSLSVVDMYMDSVSTAPLENSFIHDLT
jgi:hypothetical protein